MMRPFWRYYGGKWRMAPKYGEPVPGLPIIEPFAGAAGYATRFGTGREVLLIDRDPKIVAIWQWLIDATPDDVLAIGDIPDGGTVDDIDAPQAARWLAGFWCNNGAAQPCKSPSKWSSMSGRWFGWGAQARARISGQVESLRGWSVIEGDYSDAPDVRATWFVDPPYSTPAGAYYRFNASGIDFAHLGAWCVSRQGRVIVCEQQGADWLPFVSLGAQKAARAGKPSHEVVWCNEMRQGVLDVAGGAMSLTPYEVDILRAVFEGATDIDGVVVASLLPRDIVRRRVRSLARDGALIRHPDTGALALTLRGRESLDRAERGG